MSESAMSATEESGHSSERPPFATARRAWWWILIVTGAVVGLYLGLPQIAGLDETWGRVSEGDPWWLAAALAFEVASYGGYVLLLRGVFGRPGFSLGWRDSYDIAMAGVAATRLFGAAGIGGIALTGWALSRAGL